MANEVLGSAWVDIKAKTDTLSPQVEKGLGDAATKGSTAATNATKQTGQKIGAQIGSGLKGAKIDQQMLSEVISGGTKSEAKGVGIGGRIGSRLRSGFRSARVDQQIGDDVAKGGKKGEDEASKSSKRIGGKFRDGFREGGKGFKEMGAVFAANSGGVLGPLKDIYEQVEGLPGVFAKANKGIGTRITQLGTIVAGAGIIGQTLGSRDVQAQAQFKAAIEGTGKSFEDYREEMEKAVKGGEKLGDTFPSTVTALNRLTIATHDPEKAFKLLSAAQDISAARHISVEQAALVVGKAVNGNTRGLRAYGINVDSLTKQQAAAVKVEKEAEKATKSYAKAQDDAHKARVGVQSALERYHNTITRITAAQTGHKASTLQVEQATLSAKKAQEALSAAIHKHGADSTAARDAQTKLSIAEQKLTDVQDKGLNKTKLTISQQQALKTAYDAVQKAKSKVAQTTDHILSTSSDADRAKAAAKSAQTGVNDPADQIVSQADKYLGGQRAASVAGFQGHLKVYGAIIEDQAAKYGAQFGKALTIGGPALLGVGALIQTGIIGKTASAVGSVAKFGFSLGKISTYSGAISKVSGVIDTVRLKGMYAADAIGKGWGKISGVAKTVGDATKAAGRWIGDTAALARQRAATLASSAASKVAAGSQAVWAGVKRLFITTTDLETGATKKSLLATMAQVVWTKVAAAATKVWSGIQLAFNVVMSANPIVLVTLAIAALVGGVIYAYTHFKTFRNIVNGVATFFKNTFVGAVNVVTGAVTTVVDFVKSHWQLLLAILTGPIGLAVLAIKTHWNTIKQDAITAWQDLKNAVTGGFTKIKDAVVGGIDTVVGFFSGMGKRISDVTSGLFDGIKDAFRGAINFVIDGWNSLKFSIPSVDTHIPGVGKIGGASFGVPQIPRLATGGVTTRATIAEIGEAGPEAIIPLSRIKNTITSGFAEAVAPLAKVMKTGTDAIAHAVATAATIRSKVPGSLTAADIATAVAGGPSRGQLASASTAAARAVGPAQRAYDAAHKADDAARQHVKDLAAQITAIRQHNALYVAPTISKTSGGGKGGNVGAAQKRLDDAIAAQGAGSLDAQKARAALAKAESGGSGGKTTTKTDTAAAKAHTLETKKAVIALQQQEAQAKKTQAADDARLKSAKTKLDALKTAAKSAADAYKAALTQTVTDISTAVRGAMTGGTDIGSLFNYHPGYGTAGTAGAEGALRSLIAQNRIFGGLLHQLAANGLNQEMLQQLISAGPQAGTPIARQLLNDPTAVTTMNSLEADLQSAITSTSTNLANDVLGTGATGGGKPTGAKPKPRPKPGAGKGTIAHDGSKAGAFSPVPAMVVQGDFVVQHASDLDKLSQTLYLQQQKTKRATGGARK